MGTVGVQEMIVIFVIALVLFGPKKLPELGRTIGKAITEFRRASNDLKASFEREINYEPDHEVRSLPPAETAWNPLEPQNGNVESQASPESADHHTSASL